MHRGGAIWGGDTTGVTSGVTTLRRGAVGRLQPTPATREPAPLGPRCSADTCEHPEAIAPTPPSLTWCNGDCVVNGAAQQRQSRAVTNERERSSGYWQLVRRFVVLSISDAALAADDHDDFLPWPVSTDVQATGALPMALAAASSRFIRAHMASCTRLIVFNACLASGRTPEYRLRTWPISPPLSHMIGCLACSSCELHGSRLLRLPPFGGHGPRFRRDGRPTGCAAEQWRQLGGRVPCALSILVLRFRVLAHVTRPMGVARNNGGPARPDTNGRMGHMSHRDTHRV